MGDGDGQLAAGELTLLQGDLRGVLKEPDQDAAVGGGLTLHQIGAVLDPKGAVRDPLLLPAVLLGQIVLVLGEDDVLVPGVVRPEGLVDDGDDQRGTVDQQRSENVVVWRVADGIHRRTPLLPSYFITEAAHWQEKAAPRRSHFFDALKKGLFLMPKPWYNPF